MNSQTTLLHQQLDYLKLPFLRAQYAELAQQAAQHSWTHIDYLCRLSEGQPATAPAHHPTARQDCALSGPQNVGAVPLGLAQENQSPPDSKPLPSGIPGAEGQRYL